MSALTQLPDALAESACSPGCRTDLSDSQGATRPRPAGAPSADPSSARPGWLSAQWRGSAEASLALLAVGLLDPGAYRQLQPPARKKFGPKSRTGLDGGASPGIDCR
jgi:hypothetical protein